MIDALKSEFRKLLTVRSTYLISGLAVLISGFIAFYAKGIKASSASLVDPSMMSDNIIVVVSVLVSFCSIVAILLVTHEYRYNTIMYTLTSSNSRTKVLLAKTVVVSVYSIVLTAVVGVLTLALSRLGMSLNHLTPVAQTINYGDLGWRCLFTGWSSGMIGLVLALLIRVQVGAIVSVFLLPTLEQLLSLLLKSHATYLPFMAQSAVLTPSRPDLGTLSPGRATLVFSAYLLVGSVVAWLLFLRRDAN